MKNQYIDEKKLQKNGIDNQCSYKKLCEKDEKKFGRTKKVRTFALANEARDTHLARNCERMPLILSRTVSQTRSATR